MWYAVPICGTPYQSDWYAVPKCFFWYGPYQNIVLFWYAVLHIGTPYVYHILVRPYQNVFLVCSHNTFGTVRTNIWYGVPKICIIWYGVPNKSTPYHILVRPYQIVFPSSFERNIWYGPYQYMVRRTKPFLLWYGPYQYLVRSVPNHFYFGTARTNIWYGPYQSTKTMYNLQLKFKKKKTEN